MQYQWGSETVSSRTEQDVVAQKRLATEWDVINHRGSEQVQLIQHYQSLGMDINDATTVVDIFAKYKDILVDQKMAADGGMLPADQEVKPWKNGLVTFASFNVFGFTSLLSFIILIPFTDSDSVKFIGACIVSALALALVGIAKAKITSQNYVFSAAITVFNGAAAATAAYTLGWALKHVAGLEE
ncbi:hypothetical protein L6164_003787 [Bauhinia variegata]|uniref:Uncharacterized protein n=1 Tax=Bauhinia variegata TaxID=167791 RepID=A0ACB9Q2G0_BAUVA|nr:hypothetical protein L6164_003787 [Bauhinia variegata]